MQLLQSGLSLQLRDHLASEKTYYGSDLEEVRMPNGGSMHFSGGKGLDSIDHQCLRIGIGTIGARDDNSPQRFEMR